MATAQTIRDMWVPGVDALRGFGCWTFAEFTEPGRCEDESGHSVGSLIEGIAS